MNDLFNIISNEKVLELKSFLDDKSLNPFEDNGDSLIIACSYGNFDIFSLLYNDNRLYTDKNIDLEFCINQAFINACTFNHPKIAKVLINSKYININYENNNAFLAACFEKHFDIIELFLSNEKFKFINYNIEELKQIKNKTLIEVMFQYKELKSDIHYWFKDNFKEVYQEIKKIELAENINNF